jgi:hypothetical protein
MKLKALKEALNELCDFQLEQDAVVVDTRGKVFPIELTILSCEMENDSLTSHLQNKIVEKLDENYPVIVIGKEQK